MFSNWLTQSTSSASAPSTSTTTTTAPQPDIIIEVGPPPYARYAAHCALLSAHSGYLRSAIRPDEQQLHHHHHHQHRHHTNDTIYLPNITAEQFSPLLTYMYTGFLDLSIENIFAVLLATHVLHMPRAADICRTFLARTQSDGYLGGAFLAAAVTASTSAPPPPPPPEKGTVKIIRPIASKATPLMTAHFVAPPPSLSLAISLPSRETTFKSLHLPTTHQRNDDDDDDDDDEEVVVVVEEETPTTTVKQAMNNQDEDEERIVDVVVDEDDEPPPKIGGKKRKESKRGSGGGGRSKKSRSICEIVESPIKLDEINGGGHSKTIIDIASCDGPVRFRRVLNDAYGRCAATATTTTPTATAKSMINVANSFHLQMAKTISEQRCLQQSAEESENSQEINVGGSVNSPQPAAEQLAKVVRPIDEQVYSCVYCKHTFKSQYCYQKHAKRHINPLTLEVITGGGCEASTDLLAETIDSSGSDDKDDKTVTAAKREVRPLDMNVQYYPCKTCGSKFPSYYFVHKHRKLCHADVGDVVVLNGGEDNVSA